MSEHPQPPATSPAAEHTRTGNRIPLWVALAGMIVALILGGVIIASILQPLVNLVFPGEAEPPLPEGVLELQHVEDSRLADEEWLYATTLAPCDLARFYVEAGSTCSLSPGACLEEEPSVSGVGETIGTCQGTHEEVLASYSWRVEITSNIGQYPTIFRLYLFKERQ
ncbi:MAG: hypothetical protein HC915_03180 [Anaerolineae bacterium]|nr:hypothetical protein [Anaerolineae bacterium]